MTHEGIAATEPVYDLAEGILWDDRASVVRWVDIRKGSVLAGSLENGRLVRIQTVDLGQTAGAIALCEDGGLLVAVARGLATVSPTGAISLGPDLLGDRLDVRLNDGSVDPQGRFLVGTLSLGRPSGDEILLRVSPDGETTVLRDGVGLSNGITFSPDGTEIYHVDTIAGTVARHSYAPGPFDHAEPWVTVVTGLHYPDGLTVDARGALWVALWGGSSVRCFSPAGELLDEVMVDATQVTCPAFIGPDLGTLAITTARADLESRTDHSGAIFTTDVGVAGLPPHRWPGSTRNPYWQYDREEKIA